MKAFKLHWQSNCSTAEASCNLNFIDDILFFPMFSLNEDSGSACDSPCMQTDTSVSPADSHHGPCSADVCAFQLKKKTLSTGDEDRAETWTVCANWGGRHSCAGSRSKCDLSLDDDSPRLLVCHSTWPLTRPQLHSGLFIFRVNITAPRRSETVVDHISLLFPLSLPELFTCPCPLQIKPSRNKVEIHSVDPTYNTIIPINKTYKCRFPIFLHVKLLMFAHHMKEHKYC